MAKADSTATLRRADHPVRLSASPNWHYASMRCAREAARSVSVRHSAASFFGAESADELARMAAVRDSLYLLAAAHRNAAHRLERGQWMRARAEHLLRPVVRVSLRLRRVVTA